MNTLRAWMVIGLAAGLGAFAGTGVAVAADAPVPATPIRHGPTVIVQRHFTLQDQRAVAQTVRGYFQAFTDEDWTHLDRYLTAPFVLMGRQPHYLSSFADVLANWKHIRLPLEHTDYAASKVVHLQVTALTSDTALAEVYWQRVTKSGSVMDEGAEYYFASRQRDGSWRLNGHLGQQLAFYHGPR